MNESASWYIILDGAITDYYRPTGKEETDDKLGGS